MKVIKSRHRNYQKRRVFINTHIWQNYDMLLLVVVEVVELFIVSKENTSK